MNRKAMAMDKRAANMPATAVNDRFRHYAPEDELPVRKSDVRTSEGLRQILPIWKAFSLKTGYVHDVAVVDQEYGWVDHDALKLARYTPEDVAAFALGLSEFQELAHFADKAGVFLSALINNGKDDDYAIHTPHLSIQPSYLGYKNAKNLLVRSGRRHAYPRLDHCGLGMSGGRITVEGDAGNNAGQGISGGSVIVNGNAGAWAGLNMHGGELVVKDDSEDGIGYSMSGGSITILGNVQTKGITLKIGDYMIGGEIRIEGELSTLGDVRHGRIFHKGKLILDK
jgi:hypothetical protein